MEDAINKYNQSLQTKSDLAELAELSEADNDETTLDEIFNQLSTLQAEVKHAELEALLSGEVDSNDTFLEVHSGSGGTEAQDWAEMLLRMYTRWAEAHKYKVEYVEETEGDVAGIKSATIKICGYNAYGWLKSESGVHRLVRISPFDSNARRHTSFASVGIYPVIDDNIEISINESDCRVDTYRASGAGGQHVNTTDSAVRITHLPSGIVVTCQNERSQLQNRENALKILKSKLLSLKIEQEQQQMKEIKGELKKIEWGSQIRSYVFQPYTMVKDHRTDYETSDVQDVMNGNLQPLINEYLKKQHSK